MDYSTTAIERVKTHSSRGLKFLNLGDLRAFIDAKGFDPRVAALLGERGYLGGLFRDLVLRRQNIDADLIDQYTAALEHVPTTNGVGYSGTHEQNRRIDAALANAGIASGTRRFGEGAGSEFGSIAQIPPELRTVPIAIIGYGAAGIMAGYALERLGFTRITVFEKAKPLGIWGHTNVFGLSRNNPLRLQFYDSILHPAPGDGLEVKRFLESLSILEPQKRAVVSINPGTRKHVLHFADGSTKEFPIVINAAGLGKPKPVSDPERMTTKSEREAGIRWQYQLDRDAVAGTRLILIGLGNSTAEMLRQLHRFADAGYPADYTVLTHYPRDSVFNPTSSVPHGNKVYRVFRDTSRPNLVDWQGDLTDSRYDYFRALNEGRVISDVKSWDVKDKKMSVRDVNRKKLAEIPYDRIMTLIGYAQPRQTMEAFGCAFDVKHRCGIFDYDGECVAVPNAKDAGKRLHKGLFAFGSLLEAPSNPNAIVIPGMMHRIGDLLFSVVMRAAEYRKRLL